MALNPGPITALSLTQGLAKIAATAPVGPVKNIVLTWSPDKDVKADMDKQYKVPELRQTLAWLRNCSIEDRSVKSIKKKADVLDAIVPGEHPGQPLLASVPWPHSLALCILHAQV